MFTREIHDRLRHVLTPQDVRLDMQGAPEVRQAAGYLASALAAPTGWRLKISESARSSSRRDAIVLALTGPAAAPANPGGYDLSGRRRSEKFREHSRRHVTR